MYILIEKKKVKPDGRYRETLPDGRLILPGSEFRTLGTVSGIDLVATAAELTALIRKQEEEGVTPPPSGRLNAYFKLRIEN